MQFCFTVRWPNGHRFSKDALKLCFDDEATARKWLAAFTAALQALQSQVLSHVLINKSVSFKV